MAGLGEYGNEGFSSYHAKKNPFLMAQSLSASTVSQGDSPMKILPIFAAIAAAAAKVGTAIAATKVGGAVVAGAKAIGGKLAATKVGGAVVKGVKAVKGAVQAVKGTKVGKFITKATKKPNLGSVTGEGVKEGTKSFASKAMESFKKGEIRSGIESIKSTKGYTALSGGKSQLSAADAEGEMHASRMREGFTGPMPNIGGGESSMEKEDLSSVLGSSALAYKVAPFKMKGWSPYKSKGKSAAYSAAIGSGYSGKVGAIREGLKDIKFGSKTTF